MASFKHELEGNSPPFNSKTLSVHSVNPPDSRHWGLAHWLRQLSPPGHLGSLTTAPLLARPHGLHLPNTLLPGHFLILVFDLCWFLTFCSKTCKIFPSSLSPEIYPCIQNIGAFQVVLVVKSLPADAGDIRDGSSIPGLGRSPGEGHGNPLQYSCLENPMDRGVWRAIVHRVTKSRTWLRQLSRHAFKT